MAEKARVFINGKPIPKPIKLSGMNGYGYYGRQWSWKHFFFQMPKGLSCVNKYKNLFGGSIAGSTTNIKSLKTACPGPWREIHDWMSILSIYSKGVPSLPQLDKLLCFGHCGLFNFRLSHDGCSLSKFVSRSSRCRFYIVDKSCKKATTIDFSADKRTGFFRCYWRSAIVPQSSVPKTKPVVFIHQCILTKVLKKRRLWDGK